MFCIHRGHALKRHSLKLVKLFFIVRNLSFLHFFGPNLIHKDDDSWQIVVCRFQLGYLAAAFKRWENILPHNDSVIPSSDLECVRRLVHYLAPFSLYILHIRHSRVSLFRIVRQWAFGHAFKLPPSCSLRGNSRNYKVFIRFSLSPFNQNAGCRVYF